MAALHRPAVGLLLPALPRQEEGADDQAPERIRAPPGVLVLLQRRGVRPQPRVVGRGQRHVVERLSALELDLAQLAQGDPARSRPSAGRDAREGARRQLLPALWSRHGGAAARRRRGTRMKTLTYEVKEGVARITFNRPDAANALDMQMGLDLMHASIQASEDPAVRVVLITGAGKMFSGGGDLKRFA